MHYSGLVVLSRPESLDACVSELSSCAGFEVFAADKDTGRIVVVLETETIDQQESGLRRAQNLPHVLSAELVYHYFGDENQSSPQSNKDTES